MISTGTQGKFTRYATSLDKHVHKYLSPSDTNDAIIYTGSGLMGRKEMTMAGG